MMLIKGLIVEMDLPAIESYIRYNEAKTGPAKAKQVGEIEHMRPVPHDVHSGSLDRDFLDDRRQSVKRTPRRLEPNLSDR